MIPRNSIIFKSVLFLTLLFSNQNEQYVLLISFDGFRADYIDWYNTPNFDQLKLDGVKSEGLKPVFPTKTFPNHYSIATGMYIENHGLIGNNFFDQKLGELYTLKDRDIVEDERFYGGEPIWATAEKQGVKTASYFWVGSEANAGGAQPSIWKKYNEKRPFEARVDSVIKWFKMPSPIRPKLVLLYFHEPDKTGHHYGPKSGKTRNMVEKIDDLLGSIIKKTKSLDIYNQLNIIILSDHGMTETNKKKMIPLNKYINTKKIKVEGSGPYALLYSNDENELNKAFDNLKEVKHINIYKKNEIPKDWHFNDHYRIKDLLVLADEGWTLLENDHNVSAYFSKGNHGYDNKLKSMNAIFFAKGPYFKKNYNAPIINNIDIYPLIAHILNIIPNNKIDGKLENVQHILVK